MVEIIAYAAVNALYIACYFSLSRRYEHRAHEQEAGLRIVKECVHSLLKRIQITEDTQRALIKANNQSVENVDAFMVCTRMEIRRLNDKLDTLTAEVEDIQTPSIPRIN